MGMHADGIARAESLRVDGPLRKRPRTRWFWVAICAGGVAVLMGAAVVLPCWVPAKTTAMKNACINNLRLIERAKEDWAPEKKIGSGEIPPDEVIFGSNRLQGYMKYPPICPARGKYWVGPMGKRPTCSLAEKGHRMSGDH